MAPGLMMPVLPNCTKAHVFAGMCRVIYSFTCDHYLATHFQHDGNFVFSGVLAHPHSMHAFGGGLLGVRSPQQRPTEVDSFPQKLNFHLDKHQGEEVAV